MKVFISSTYIDLVEHRKAAHDENHPRMHEQRVFHSFIRNPFVDRSDSDRITT
jgi:hypothetical protein